ncbi:MAG TPA: hypothetical protein PLY93_12970 [Turneriella sp.]|nr:hypothetical protein [Turneriella sp.]
MNFIQKQKEKIKAWWLQNHTTQVFQKNVWPTLEKFIIAGPLFVGFILGIWRYAPGSKQFEVAFQSLVFFVVYLSALIFFQLLDSIFFDSMPIILASIRSFLALAYIGVTLKQFFEWRHEKLQFYPLTQRLRSRISLLP